MCSPILDSKLVVHKVQVVDEVSLEQSTCTIIYDDYLWEPEEELVVEDDLLLSSTHPIFCDTFGDSAIVNFPCENSFLDESTSYHSHNTPDVSFPLQSGEDKSLFANPFTISSIITKNVEGEHSCFSSTPLHYSSDHEDADEHIKFYDCGCGDFFTPFDHNVDSFTIYISKPTVFDVLSVDEVETPQAVKAL